MSRIVGTIQIYDEVNGLVVFGRALEATIPTTTGLFAPGARILGVDGVTYNNEGSTESPSWQNSNEVTPISGRVNITGQLNIDSISTTTVGLIAGDVWSNDGVLTIVS